MDKTYLILGASSEIGMAYINKLNSEEQGSKVIACYRSMSEAFSELCDKCDNIELMAIQADLADSSMVDELIETINAEELQPTHILHLAAPAFEYMKIKQWDDAKAKVGMEVALFSFAKICSAYLPAMAKKKYGRVVAMLTSYTLGTPPKYMSDYVASKYALLGFIKAAAAEYAGAVNINAVSPNMIETKFIKNINDKIVTMTAESSAMKRNVKIDEVVEAIDFLMSDKASYISGENLNISGGDYM